MDNLLGEFLGTMFLIILGALVAFTAVIMIAANTITSSTDEARGDDPRLRAAITERIKPIGKPVKLELAHPVSGERLDPEKSIRFQ